VEEKSSKEWLAPLTGIAFILLIVASFIIAGDEPPSADEEAQRIVDHYLDNEDALKLSAFLGAVAGTALIFFFAYVSKLLRAARGEGGMLSTLVVVGAAIIGVGAAIDGTLTFAMVEAADDIEPESIRTLQALWDNDFLPFVLGMQVLWLALGLSLVKSDVLPKWLGWVALAIGVIAFAGPASFFALPLGALWIIVASIMLTLRARSGSGPAATPTV
jgi:hypothetical protein